MIPNESALSLIGELWDASTPEQRCPHVAYDGRSCRCNAVDALEAELVCDTASLHLWCLGGQCCPLCLFFPKGAD